MSVQGLCQLCEAEPAAHQCRRCGSLVCTTHYVRERGLCTECAAELPPSEDDRTGGSSG